MPASWGMLPLLTSDNDTYRLSLIPIIRDTIRLRVGLRPAPRHHQRRGKPSSKQKKGQINGKLC